MKNVVIVVAAGRGKRFTGRVPKQFVKLRGVELLAGAVMRFEAAVEVDAIVIVTAKNYVEYTKKKIVKKYGMKKVIGVIKGGKERFNSVYNAICFFKKYNPVNVLVHDGARAVFDTEIIKEILKGLKKEKAVIPMKRISETVKIVSEKYVVKTIDRNKLGLAVTPQGFRYTELEKLYTKKNIEKYRPTDEAALFEKMGCRVAFVEDTGVNIKVTVKEDLALLKNMLGDV